MEEEQAGQPTREPRRPVPEELLERLTGLETRLADLLDPIDEIASRMDSSLKNAHELVEEIRAAVKSEVFASGGPLEPPDYQEVHGWFEDARVEENDMYEVYDHVLAHQQKRLRDKTLGTAAADEDKLAQVRRRRAYIGTLRVFRKEFAGVLDYLRERSAEP